MLERAAACIEPSSQLFLRCIEPPVRSLRALGQSFWAQNGGKDLSVPPWWPLYLETVRRIPHVHDGISRTQATSRMANPSGASKQDNGPLQGIKLAPEHSRRSIRPYSESIQSRQQPHSIDQEGYASAQLDTLFDRPENDHTAGHVPATKEGIEFRGRGSDSRIQERLSNDSPIHQPIPLEARDPRISDLKKLLTQKSAQGPLDFQKAWTLFVSLADQQVLASPMLAYLSLSQSRRDLLRALEAFSLIVLDNRSQADYDNAVRAAVRTSRYNLALQMCQQALEKNLAQRCRQILLVGCFSQGLWRTAASVWTSMFDSSADFSSRGIADWAIVDRVRELPTYLLQLCTQLNRDDPVLRTKRGELRALASCMFQRVLLSHRIMGSITPKGMFELFHQFSQMFVLHSNHYSDVLRTLAAMPRQRPDLAVTIYRNFRFTFPDENLSSSLLCSLIILCDKARFPRYIFDYWLQELKKIDETPPPDAYRYLMWALAHQGDVEGVERLFSQLIKEHGRPKDPKLANPLLYAHAATGNVAAVEAVVRKLEQSFGTVPNLVSWNLLFFACSRSKEPRRAFAAFDRMDKKKVPPDAVTFGTLVGICSRVGDTLAARSLIDVAKDYGVPVTDDMLAKLAHSHCLNGEPEEAIKLALSTNGMGFEKPPIRIWNNLLRHHAFQADFPAIRRIQNYMKDAGVVPDEMTYAAILTSLVRVKRTTDALKLLRSLHFDGTVTATSFHYSIILHGFAMEKNRNMVEIIYREMEERFPNMSPSAQLAMLHTQTQRGSPRGHHSVDNSEKLHACEYRQAMSFMHKIMSQTSPIARTTSEPQPGFQRRPPHEVGTSIYSDHLARYLAFNKKPIQAHQLLNHYNSLKETEDRALQADETVEILTTRLLVAFKLYHWTEVENLWCKILQAGAESSQRIPLQSLSALPNVPLDSARKMMKHLQSVFDDTGTSIPDSMRFILSVPFSFYMQALDRQLRHDDLIKDIQDFQQLGFALSSKNWNSYVQVLCRSPNSTHQFHAYTVFEDVLRNNTPPWRVLVNSKWVEHWRRKSVPTRRRFLEQIDPGKAVPTYFTMVFMASVLLHFRQQAQRGIIKNFQALNVAYPELCRVISRVPYSRDKLRRVLLMGKRPHPNPPKQPKYQTVLRGGIAGSKSLLDHIPAEILPQAEDTLSRKALKASKGTRRAHVKDPLSISELISGETIQANLEREKRHGVETDEERDDRIQKRAKRGLLDLEQMRQDHSRQALVMQDSFGDPVNMPKTLEREFSGGHKVSHKAIKVDKFSVTNGAELHQEVLALRKRIRDAGRPRLSAFALAERTVQPRSRRQIKRLERCSRWRVWHARLRAEENRRNLQMRLQRRRRFQEAERRARTGVGQFLWVPDAEGPHVEDVGAGKYADLSGEPSQAEDKTQQQEHGGLTPLNWKGDRPADKLIEKLLPRRSQVPKSREGKREQWLKSQEEKRVSDLEGLRSRQSREGGQTHGRGRGRRSTVVKGERKDEEGERDGDRRPPRDGSSGVSDQLKEKEKVNEYEHGKPLEQWRWDGDTGGFRF